jgi:hypothetical protein
MDDHQHPRLTVFRREQMAKRVADQGRSRCVSAGLAQSLNGCLPYLGVLTLCSIPQMSPGFGDLAPAKKNATELEMCLAGTFVLPTAARSSRSASTERPEWASILPSAKKLEVSFSKWA